MNGFACDGIVCWFLGFVVVMFLVEYDVSDGDGL